MAFFTPWKLSSQKLGFFLVTFGFIWGMMLLHFTIQQRTQPESSSMLREQILDLSKRYIKALAEENRNVVDGPYAGVMTAYGECGGTGMACSIGCALTLEGHVVLLRFEDSLFSWAVVIFGFVCVSFSSLYFYMQVWICTCQRSEDNLGCESLHFTSSAPKSLLGSC